MKTICIYHGNCADGFGAAWVVQQWGIKMGVEVEFVEGHYGHAPPDCTGANVVLVDFSYKRDVLLEIAKVAATLTIIDHHKTAAEDLEGIADEAERLGYCKVISIFSMEHSGAGLTWAALMSEYDMPPLIAHIQDRDLWKFELQGTREIMNAVFSYPYNFDTWSQLMGAPLEFLYAQGEAITRKHFKDLEELLKKRVRRVTIAGHDVPMVNLPYTMGSDAGNQLAQGEKFAAIYSDGDDARHFSLRSTDAGEDVSAIAATFGGGGHRNAAGFRVPFTELVALGLQ